VSPAAAGGRRRAEDDRHQYETPDKHLEGIRACGPGPVSTSWLDVLASSQADIGACSLACQPWFSGTFTRPCWSGRAAELY
jgi:hypothetical protein